MSVLSWFDGKEGPEYETARWVHDQVEDRIRSRDVVGLAELCAAIKPVKGVFCGIMLAGFLGRDEVVRDAFEELQSAVRTMPDEVCERVFAIVERGNLPIHLAKRREQLQAARDHQLATTIDTIRTQLASCEPRLLVRATTGLVRKDDTIFDLPLSPTLIERAELAEVGLARLRELLVALPDDECWEVMKLVRERSLPIDTQKRAAEIERRRNLAAIASDAESEPRNADLEAALASNLEDAIGYAVFGDFLQRHGHPRGELIALQLRAETDQSIAADAESFLETHGEAILGSLATLQQTREHQPRPTFTWRRGFIDRILLAIEYLDRPDDPTRAELLRRAFKHPAGRLIRGVRVTSSGQVGRILGSTTVASLRESTLEQLIEVIATEQAGRLREVLFDMPSDEESGHANVEVLWDVPDLRSVRMQGVNVDVGTIEHPLLERAVFSGSRISRSSVRAIASARWPRIQRLEIGLPEVVLDDVQILLARTDLPRLVYLGLQDTPCTDDICRVVTTSPLAAQLAQLDLSYGSMTDAGARTLARGVRSLPNLETVVVSENRLTSAGVAALQAAFRNVVAVDQADPDDFIED